MDDAERRSSRSSVPAPADSGPSRREERRADEALFGEYSSPRLRLPGWGLASLLMAAPGVLVPWLLPALMRSGLEWSAARPLLLVVPVTALVGLVFGALGVRREDGSATALVGLALNVVLLMMVGAIVFILVF